MKNSGDEPLKVLPYAKAEGNVGPHTPRREATARRGVELVVGSLLLIPSAVAFNDRDWLFAGRVAACYVAFGILVGFVGRTWAVLWGILFGLSLLILCRVVQLF